MLAVKNSTLGCGEAVIVWIQSAQNVMTEASNVLTIRGLSLVLNVEAASRPPTQRRAATAAAAALSDLK